MSRLVWVLASLIVVDLLATGLVYATHRDDPPHLPDFTQLSGTAPGDVEALTSLVSLDASAKEAGSLLHGVRPSTSESEVFDPDASAIAAIQALEGRAGDEPDYARATRILVALVHHMEDGFLPHENRPAIEIPELPDRWISAKTQGLALSALSRAYAATGQHRWKSAADQAFETFLRIRDVSDEAGVKPTTWTGFIDPMDYLWFEQYPQAPKPSQLLTGHIWATIGLADYVQIAGGGYRLAASELFSGGAATASYYAEVVRRPFIAARVSPATEERSLSEHRLIKAQMTALSAITHDRRFAETARHYLTDSALAEFAVSDVRLARGIDVYDRLPLDLLESAQVTEEDVVLLGALESLRRSRFRAAARDVSSILADARSGFVAHQTPVRNTPELSHPWYSAQTQGLLLSTLVDLCVTTGDERWRHEADRVFATFKTFRGYSGNAHEPPQRWIALVGDEVSYGNLWYTAFSHPADPAQPVSHQVMAQLTAIFGLYDYWSLTGSPVAKRLVDGAVSTVESRLFDIRVPNGPSVSDLATDSRSLSMHRAVTQQLKMLSKVVAGNDRFALAADLLRRDAR